MATRCPLCRAGALSAVTRELVREGKRLATEAYLCSSCREVLLDGEGLERLRAAIRREGLATSDAEVDAIVERITLQSG